MLEKPKGDKQPTAARDQELVPSIPEPSWDVISSDLGPVRTIPYLPDSLSLA